eukprot:Pgem_evm1s3924
MPLYDSFNHNEMEYYSDPDVQSIRSKTTSSFSVGNAYNNVGLDNQAIGNESVTNANSEYSNLSETNANSEYSESYDSLNTKAYKYEIDVNIYNNVGLDNQFIGNHSVTNDS